MHYQAAGDCLGESKTRYNLAQAYAEAGDLSQAVDELRRAVALDEFASLPHLAEDRAELKRLLAELQRQGAPEAPAG